MVPCVAYVCYDWRKIVIALVLLHSIENQKLVKNFNKLHCCIRCTVSLRADLSYFLAREARHEQGHRRRLHQAMHCKQIPQFLILKPPLVYLLHLEVSLSLWPDDCCGLFVGVGEHTLLMTTQADGEEEGRRIECLIRSLHSALWCFSLLTAAVPRINSKCSICGSFGRQRGRVVYGLEVHGSNPPPCHQLDLFSVIPSSTPRSRYVNNQLVYLFIYLFSFYFVVSFPDVVITITEAIILLSQGAIVIRPTAEKKEGDTGQRTDYLC